MSVAKPRISLAQPRFSGRLFRSETVNELILGDSAIDTSAMLDAFVFFARREGLARLYFWGRGAPCHLDRARELLHGARDAPEIAAFCRFEPVDMIEDAERMTQNAISAFAILDSRDALEARMIAALEGEAFISAVM